MTRGRLRVGIVGCGSATTTIHLPALDRVPGVSVVALADRDAERLAATAERWDVPARHESHEALLAADDVEAVLVALPPRFHPEVASDVLAAGRHLLLEKPIALDVAAAERLAATAEAADVTAATAFNLRSHPYLPAARGHLSGGLLGPVRSVRSVFTTAARTEGSWRARTGEGGHVLLDLAIHHLDLAEGLSGGSLEGVTARPCGSPGSPSRGDREGAVTVEGRLPGGARFTGRYARGEEDANVVELRCDRGSLRLAFYELDGLRVRPLPDAPVGAVERLRLRLDRVVRLVRNAPSLRRGGPFRDSYVRQWEDFAGAVLEGRPPACTIREGARALRTALAALDGLGRGRMSGAAERPEADPGVA